MSDETNAASSAPDLGVLVMGMHRSGTSAVARALLDGGLAGGDEDGFERAAPANPTGFAERRDVRLYNESLLQMLGWRWDAPAADPPSQLRVPTGVIDEGRHLLSQVASTGRPWLLKDPRLSILLPAWRAITLDRFVAVVTYREPEEVAWSLRVRDGMQIETALALWAAYYRHLSAGARGLQVVVVSYPALLADPQQTVEKLVETLRDFGVADGFDTDRAIGALRPALRRATYAGGARELFTTSSITEIREQWHTDSVTVHKQLDLVPPASAWWEATLLTMQYQVRTAEEASLAHQRDGQQLGWESDAASARADRLAAELAVFRSGADRAAGQYVAIEASLTAELEEERLRVSALSAERESLQSELRDRIVQTQRLQHEVGEQAAARSESTAAAERARHERDELGKQQVRFVQHLHVALPKVGIRRRLAARFRRSAAGLPIPLPQRLTRHPLFDAEWYERRYPDVSRARLRGYRHYRRHGLSERRNPNAFFDTRWYLEQNPDVHDRGIDPIDHYLLYGWREGRDPSPRFRSSWYLYENPDVLAARVNPLAHFLHHGRAEGRMPAPAARSPDPNAATADAPLPPPAAMQEQVFERKRGEVPSTAEVPAPRQPSPVGIGLPDNRRVFVADKTAAGISPGCGATAIGLIEAARIAGYDTLLLTQSSAWWVDSYPELRGHLDRRYERINGLAQGYLAWALDRPSAWREVDSLLRELSVCLEHEPLILDWQSGTDIAKVFDDFDVFSPPTTGERLPYLDGTVDVVVLSDGSKTILTEARRIASAAVVQLKRPTSVGRISIAQTNVYATLPEPPAVILLGRRDAPIRAAQVDWVLDSLASRARPQLIVAGVHDLADASHGVESDANRGVEIIASDGQSPTGLKDAIAAVRGPVLAVLDARLRPIAGWWPTMARRARNTHCLVGGVVLDDRGHSGEIDPCSPRDAYTRKVDELPASFVVATKAALVAALAAGRSNERVPILVGDAYLDPSAIAISSDEG